MKEATKEQWQALYQVASQIRDLEPWNTFGDLELIGLTPKGFKDPFFISIMGMETEHYGVLVYMGLEGFKDFARLAFSSQLRIPETYAFFEQTYLSCHFVPQEDLLEDDKAFLASLDISFQESQWVPIFESAKKGYFIDSLDELAVILLTHLLHELKAPLCDEETYKKVRYDQGQYIHKRYNEENGAYQHVCETLPKDLILIDEYIISNQLMIKKAQKIPQGHYHVQLDLVHMPMEVPSNQELRMVMPKMLIVCDTDSGEVLATELIGEGMDLLATILTSLGTLIENRGRMRSIYVCNTLIVGMLADYCEKLKIDLLQTEVLLHVEAFLEALSETEN